MVRRPLRIVIPGGSGQLGLLLARHFHDSGHRVTSLARHPKPAAWRIVHWTASELGSWVQELDGADVVINLAGRSVNCRYTQANRREILYSRTIPTGLIGQAIAQAKLPPALWLNASTSTLYPHSTQRGMDEDWVPQQGADERTPAKWDFSMQVARSWESSLFAANTPRTRRVALRTSMVMSPEPGGVFDILLGLVRAGLGGTAGPGNQYVSWIHHIDFIRAVEFLVEHEELTGPVNICSPCPIANRTFMRCLRQAWCTTYIGLPAPRWALELGAAVMRTETELVLKSRRVIPKRLQDAGFDFHFPNWRGAAQDLVTHWRRLREA